MPLMLSPAPLPCRYDLRYAYAAMMPSSFRHYAEIFFAPDFAIMPHRYIAMPVSAAFMLR